MGITESKLTLADPISHLESNFVRQSDINKLDDCVTATEMKEYVIEKCSQKDAQIAFLEKEVERLQAELRHKQVLLERKIDDRHIRDIESFATQGVSPLSIRQYVEEISRGCGENIPEAEKEIYRRTMKVLLTSLQKTLNQVSLDIMGHTLTVSIVPQTPTTLKANMPIRIVET